MHRILLLISLVFLTTMATAQHYNPAEAFAQDFYPTGGNAYRSANGAPGSDYWQNQVDYRLEAVFDTTNHILTGTATIHYKNNSPDSLDFLWLALDQNVDKKDGLGNQMNQPVGTVDKENGFRITSVACIVKEQAENLPFSVFDTRMKVKLKTPLAGNGSIIDIRVQYQFKLLEKSAAGRAGILQTPQGTIFEFGYWYPRLCVYDDLRGWNTLPFVGGGEFYCEYGNFDYKITVPSGMLVAGGGRLLNGKEILSEKIMTNLENARQSDKTVIIRSAEEVRTLCPTKKEDGLTTWHFEMKNTRDVAFAASRSFLWDAAKINLPDGKTALAQSFYPEASAAAKDGWRRATEFVKASVEIFSEKWFVYPYPEATNVAGPVGGMEFPGISFDWHDVKKGKSFWALISHEIGHTWYPMIVGANERRYPFMDEGFNTFIDIYAQEEFNKGEFAPKRDGEYAPKGGNPADEIIPVMKELQGSYTLLHAPDFMSYKHVHPLFYFKTAFGLVLLREVILGHERFDEGFRAFTERWAYKHPAPNDFFRTMDNVSGEDLSWFWRGWFAHNWLLDQAVKSVEYDQDKLGKGTSITLENREKLVMPAIIDVTEENGKVHRLKLPVNIWSHGPEWTFQVATTSKVVRVVLDPDHQLPDIDRKNNIWEGDLH